MTKSNTRLYKGVALMGVASLGFLAGFTSSGFKTSVPFLERGGEPAYLTELRSTGVRVSAIYSSPLSELGLQGWEIQRPGDRLFAYSPFGSKSLIVGGELYNEEGLPLGNKVEIVHQRQQLSFQEIEGEATWFSLSSEGEKATPIAYLLIDPSTEDAQQGYRDLLALDVDLERLWVAPYPESDSQQSMPVSTAIYESDYRTPAGASPIVTDRRGGDLGFTHYSYQLLIDALNGHVLKPLAPYDHPAEVQAIQAISSVIYLKDRLDISANSVLIEKKDQKQGLSWEIYPLLPVRHWIDQLNQGAGSPQ